MSDNEWKLIQPCVPGAKPGGGGDEEVTVRRQRLGARLDRRHRNTLRQKSAERHLELQPIRAVGHGTRDARAIPTAAAGILEGGQSVQHVASTEDSRGRDGGFVETFHNPPEVRSAGGVLTLTLTAELQDVEIAGQRVQARVYNGLYIPPTLRVHPGDTMHITLINAIDQPTNLHHHGSNVSPLNNGDNVFVDLLPGQIFNQRIVFPPDHPPGFLWYHPHRHMFVEAQIFGGMSGGLIVEGLLEPFPQLQGVKERDHAPQGLPE